MPNAFYHVRPTCERSPNVQALIVSFLVLCLVAVLGMFLRDREEYGTGCAFVLLALFVGVVFVTVASMLASHGRIP